MARLAASLAARQRGDAVTPAALTAAALDIRRLHHEAQAHASRAVDLANQAGRILLAVKASLPHGEFLPWLKAHCQVTARQAQRYMGAAQGRLPTPRKLLDTAPAKNDTMSHLPPLRPPFDSLSCAAGLHFFYEAHSWSWEGYVTPSTHAGFWHFGIFNGGNFVYSRKPGWPDVVQLGFDREFPDWRLAKILEFEFEATARNPLVPERWAVEDLLGRRMPAQGATS